MMLAVVLLMAAVAPFSAVEISGDVEVVITAAGADASFDAPAGISAEVKDRTLVIIAPPSQKSGAVVSVRAPALSRVQARGAARVDVKGLDNKALDVALQDSARATLAGKCASLRVEAGGSARLDAARLETHDARVVLSRAARATVAPTGSLSAELDGASVLTSTKTPKRVDKTVKGAARLKLP